MPVQDLKLSNTAARSKTPMKPGGVPGPTLLVSRKTPASNLATKTPLVAANPPASRVWNEYQSRTSNKLAPDRNHHQQQQHKQHQQQPPQMPEDLKNRLGAFLKRNVNPRHQPSTQSQSQSLSQSQNQSSNNPFHLRAIPATVQPIRHLQIQPPATSGKFPVKTPARRVPILKTNPIQLQPHPLPLPLPHLQPHPLPQPTSQPQPQPQPLIRHNNINNNNIGDNLQQQPLVTIEHQQHIQQPPKLIQDTRVPNRVGPIATATKAPLSVSQFTQPTPSSNKSTGHQISRAQSEPTIKYQVKVNDKLYKILRKIGSGGSAKVYEGFEPTTYQTVAIKIINVGQADAKTQESYFNEKRLLSRLQDSKHVVRIFNSEYKAECKELVIVMEKGDADLSQILETHFKLREGRRIDGVFIKFYWRGMLMAVNEIHKHGIIHADLKPVNFILVKNQIKLIDFGIASSVDPGGTSIIRDYQIGTINYMAPETLRNRASDASFIIPFDDNNDLDNLGNRQKRTVIKYNTKADIWSLGCILYTFVYGRPPFDSYQDILGKLQAIINPNHKIDFPRINNMNLLNCMKACLEYDKEKRPSAEELLDHPYLKEDVLVLESM